MNKIVIIFIVVALVIAFLVWYFFFRKPTLTVQAANQLQLTFHGGSSSSTYASIYVSNPTTITFSVSIYNGAPNSTYVVFPFRGFSNATPRTIKTNSEGYASVTLTSFRIPVDTTSEMYFGNTVYVILGVQGPGLVTPETLLGVNLVLEVNTPTPPDILNMQASYYSVNNALITTSLFSKVITTNQPSIGITVKERVTEFSGQPISQPCIPPGNLLNEIHYTISTYCLNQISSVVGPLTTTTHLGTVRSTLLLSYVTNAFPTCNLSNINITNKSKSKTTVILKSTITLPTSATANITHCDYHKSVITLYTSRRIFEFSSPTSFLGYFVVHYQPNSS